MGEASRKNKNVTRGGLGTGVAWERASETRAPFGMTTRPGVRTGISEGMGAALGTFDHEDVLEEGRLVVAAVVARNGSLVLRPLRVLAARALYTDRVSDADSCRYTGRQGLIRQVLAALAPCTPCRPRPCKREGPRVCAARGTPRVLQQAL